jgi:hypothetical protein
MQQLALPTDKCCWSLLSSHQGRTCEIVNYARSHNTFIIPRTAVTSIAGQVVVAALW